MITPLDIQNKEFSKAVRGYKEEEVDEFLDLLTVDLERLITENANLKKEIEKMNGEINRHRDSEGAVLKTLEAAKALMGDISASAEKRAEILLKNAELDAQLIQREAKESAERLAEENAQLRSRFIEFRGKYKSMLESELARFDTLSNDIFGDLIAEQNGAAGSASTGTMGFGKTSRNALKESLKETKVIDDEEYKKAISDDDMSKTKLNIK